VEEYRRVVILGWFWVGFSGIDGIYDSSDRFQVRIVICGITEPSATRNPKMSCKGINVGHTHPFWTIGDLYDVIACANFSLRQPANVESWSVMFIRRDARRRDRRVRLAITIDIEPANHSAPVTGDFQGLRRRNRPEHAKQQFMHRWDSTTARSGTETARL